MKRWCYRRLKSFSYAGKGVVSLFASQPNARIHLSAALLVLVVGWHLDITPQDWAVLALVIALVIAMEALNTSLEFVCDALHPEQHPLIGKAKDVAAAAVLICAFFAVIIGLLILYPAFAERYLI